jgi:phage-related protein
MLEHSESLPLEPIASSLTDLTAMTEGIRSVFGGALSMAQRGVRPEGARPFGEGLPCEIMKMVQRHDGDPFRMAFSSSLSGAVYLLDVFKKKSSLGAATPQKDLRRIHARWQAARLHHQEFYEEE